MLITQIFPASPELRGQIPLWLKFYCYEYSNNSLYRAVTSVIGAPMIRCIQVPAPREFATITDVEYNTKLGIDDTRTEADPMDGLMGPISDLFRLDDAFLNLFGLGINIDMDMSDTKFVGVNKRVFTFKLVLPARTEEDAQAASDIAVAFEALSFPTARLDSISKQVDHPPMWSFGMGPIDDLQNDRAWSGQPQLSLLDKVTVNKSAFQDSYAISNGGKLKPLAQSINLSFIELEPAMRSSAPFTNDIINRSTAFYTLGGLAKSGLNAGQAIGRAAGFG
jgi:hypothetical protein